MISNAIEEMDKSVEVADQLADNLNMKLQKFEKLPTDELDQEQAVQVLELLDSVTEVKQEYDALRKELQDVQHLQKEMNASLRYQIQSMNQTFKILKKKIEANPSHYSAVLQRLPSSNKIH